MSFCSRTHPKTLFSTLHWVLARNRLVRNIVAWSGPLRMVWVPAGPYAPLRMVLMKKRSSWLMKNTLPLFPGLGSSRSALSPDAGDAGGYIRRQPQLSHKSQ